MGESLNVTFTGSSSPEITEDSTSFVSPQEHKLLTYPLKGVKHYSGGSNEIHIVRLRGGIKCVFKPSDGEQPLDEFAESHFQLYKRERAAFLASEGLGCCSVPTTVIREVAGRVGSLQKYVENHDVFWYGDRLVDEEDLYTIALFDYCIWNKDRKGEHLLAAPAPGKVKKKLWGIDNGLSFDEWPQYLISENLEEYVFGRIAPSHVVHNFQHFLGDQKKQNFLREHLTTLVPTRAVAAFFARVECVGGILKKKGRVDRTDLVTVDLRQKLFWENDIQYHPETRL